jgi:REP element-mobilizing transposase RayT
MYRVHTLADSKQRLNLSIMPRRAKQLGFTDYRRRTGRGGPRPGAGRRPGPRPRVLHRAREPIPTRCPIHVTLRVRKEVSSLRTQCLVREVRRTLALACERGEFRVAHYSIQRDHVHMIVEAHGRDALARGMKSVAARLARAVNRVFSRSGPVLDGRFHHRVLRTPREVRHALAYVLLNARRHVAMLTGGRRPPVRLDAASSARWFDGWKQAWKARLGPPGEASAAPREVAAPHTWLLRVGWRRHGLVDPSEVPGGRAAT